MAFVTLACAEASHWNGDLVLHVTDNDSMVLVNKATAWESICAFAGLLDAALGDGIWLLLPRCLHSTYHNEMADWISGVSVGEVIWKMTTDDWERVDCIRFPGPK